VSVSVRITRSFKTAVKPLLKKYPSLSRDLLKLEKQLQQDPKLGTSLGHNAFKIRLKVSSKAKGKSGGARVISLVESILISEVQLVEEQITVNLLTIYDKADTASISNKELKDLIKAFDQDE
jgi:mRNA-degrading endonuclease RelE of RelBE toxin-antitoxin system